MMANMGGVLADFSSGNDAFVRGLPHIRERMQRIHSPVIHRLLRLTHHSSS